MDGPLQIVLEPRPSINIKHVEGYPVIPRPETIEYVRENYARFRSALAVLNRTYEDVYPGVTYRESERAQTQVSITGVTHSSNCSSSSRKWGKSASLSAATLLRCLTYAPLQASISSSHQTPRLNPSNSSNSGTLRKRTAASRTASDYYNSLFVKTYDGFGNSFVFVYHYVA